MRKEYRWRDQLMDTVGDGVGAKVLEALPWLEKLIDLPADRDPMRFEDKPWMYQADIEAAHPIRTGDHKTYAKALDLVSERHAKYDLVDLVNWLLRRALVR